MKNKLKLALSLFFDYFKIGLFTFGGGYAMITLIEKTFVEKRKYISEEELLDIVAIAEATPGVMAINSATYIGYKVLGFWGSLMATIGVSTPSFVIILIVSFFYEKLVSIKYVKYFIDGLMVAVTFLILRAGIKLFKSAKKDALSYILIALSFIALLLIKFFNVSFSTVYMILLGGLISLIVYLFGQLISKKKKAKEIAKPSDIKEEGGKDQ